MENSPKNRLQEVHQKLSKALPRYDTTCIGGEGTHMPQFHSRVTGDLVPGGSAEGSGRSKKIAEQEAARAAIRAIQATAQQAQSEATGQALHQPRPRRVISPDVFEEEDDEEEGGEEMEEEEEETPKPRPARCSLFGSWVDLIDFVYPGCRVVVVDVNAKPRRIMEPPGKDTLVFGFGIGEGVRNLLDSTYCTAACMFPNGFGIDATRVITEMALFVGLAAKPKDEGGLGCAEVEVVASPTIARALVGVMKGASDDFGYCPVVAGE